MRAAPSGQRLASEQDGPQNLVEALALIDVGPGHDGRQWYATAPKRSAGSAFHWQPVRSTYTMASNTWRAGLGGRPAPGLRRYFLPGAGDRGGISGSTRCQNASVTTHESTRFWPTRTSDAAYGVARNDGIAIYG